MGGWWRECEGEGVCVHGRGKVGGEWKGAGVMPRRACFFGGVPCVEGE